MRSPLFFIGQMLILFILLAGCGSSTPEEPKPAGLSDTSTSVTPEKPQAEYKKLTPKEAQDLMSDDVIVLDVRTQAEYNDGHIPHSVLLPDYEIKDGAEIVVPNKRQTILVYCRSGARSERAAKTLIELGYTDVYDLGGIIHWTGEIVR